MMGHSEKRSIFFAILVAALGYFVDVYDLILFSVVRVSSLKDLNVAADDLLDTGAFLLSMQMTGMLFGGILWGILGDKKGRLSVLFGSILLYSTANILNGMVESVEGYAWLRLIAGIGLAGELGAGITLVAEIMPRESRGYATTIVATVGVFGAVVASLVASQFEWRSAYYVGGGLGLGLLVLRIAVNESGLFKSLVNSTVKKGDLLLLVRNKDRFLRYLSCILIGVPIWYAIGIPITFCPEIGKALQMPELPSTGTAVLYSYIGLTIGDLASGLLSQYLGSRKRTVFIFLTITTLGCITILNLHSASTTSFYFVSGLLGFGVGYWAVFVTTAAEQFGTNLRATVATTTPNFVRGSVVPMTWAFTSLRPEFGILNSAMLVGVVVLALAFISAFKLQESFSQDLDYLEH